MSNNVSMQIEKLKLKTGSYIEAVMEFSEHNKIYDYEDLLEILNPITYNNIRQEFIDKNFIPNLKTKNGIDDFLKG
jgi:predicted metal-dependent phosphotriesterase family hydrolase